MGIRDLTAQPELSDIEFLRWLYPFDWNLVAAYNVCKLYILTVAIIGL